MHQQCPATECRAIPGEDIEAGAHLNEPALDGIGLGRALIAGEFDPGLDLDDCHTVEIEFTAVNALNPGDHPAMGAWPAEFRQHIGV